MLGWISAMCIKEMSVATTPTLPFPEKKKTKKMPYYKIIKYAGLC